MRTPNIDSFLAPHAVWMLRHEHDTLSDEDYKAIREINPRILGKAMLEQIGDLSGAEVEYLHKNCEEPFEHDWNYGHEWKDDVLDKYANHIKNYYYNYKPEAQELDPDIDPEEEHIGPMAQDIEQVNPAAVKETPEGVKTVDTERLALMNAGVIADLAREVKEIKEETPPKEEPKPVEPVKKAIKATVESPKKPKKKESMLMSMLLKGKGR